MSQFNDLLMPKLGLTMTEGMLVEWAVAPGDAVRAGDLLFVVETEKVANEVMAEAGGVIGEILVQPGETVPVGTVVGRWTGPGQAGSATQPEQGGSVGVPQTDALQNPRSMAPDEAVAEATRAALTAPNTPTQCIVATPLARRLAREHGLELATVKGSGPNGRIKAADVRHSVPQSSTPIAN